MKLPHRRQFLHLAAALAATVMSASAQTPSPIKRTVLQEIEHPNGYIMSMVIVEIPANFSVQPHTHPGAEVAYVMEGEATITIAGKAPVTVRAGDSLLFPANVVHHGKTGPAGVKLLNTYVLEKGKPISSPATLTQ